MRPYLFVVLFAACSDSEPTLATDEMQLGIIPGTVTCASQGLGNQMFTLPQTESGLYQIDVANSFFFQYYDDSRTSFFFTQSSVRMKGVLVAAGGNTAVWELDGATGWPSLHGPVDATGNVMTPESVSFCFDYDLFLDPAAYASYGVSHGWSISKTGPADPLTLATGQTYAAPYQVRVETTGSTTAGLTVSGPVLIHNPTPYTPRIDAVSVMVGELAATVTCPSTYPFVVPAFAATTCHFTVAVPDTNDRLVYVDVIKDGGMSLERSLETASFANPTTTSDQIDDCITVYDSQVASPLGTACITDGAKTFTYDAPIGPFAACGPFSVANSATYVGNDTGATGSSSWTVVGTVPCASGCTLSAGYWKTHSELGPAPYDDVWAQVGTQTPFFLSGGSYHGALSTPPGGNAYWTLARAFAAAQLNTLNGASPAVIQATYAQAEDVLASTTPAHVAASRTVRNTVVRLAAILNDWNTGLTGPGHCDE